MYVYVYAYIYITDVVIKCLQNVTDTFNQQENEQFNKTTRDMTESK